MKVGVLSLFFARCLLFFADLLSIFDDFRQIWDVFLADFSIFVYFCLFLLHRFRLVVCRFWTILRDSRRFCVDFYWYIVEFYFYFVDLLMIFHHVLLFLAVFYLCSFCFCEFWSIFGWFCSIFVDSCIYRLYFLGLWCFFWIFRSHELTFNLLTFYLPYCQFGKFLFDFCLFCPIPVDLSHCYWFSPD